MSKVKVLFFAADPLSAPPHGRAPRLGLDEDVRQIRGKVRGAKYRDALEFDFRMAARTDDLLQALNETHPQVVHFSGHGGTDGLVLVSSDGRRPHPVGEEALSRLFRLFRGDIQVAVLNACFSLPQARAIAGEVGCAIGTSGKISDTAAITFGGSFYRAIAFGKSVKAAYDEAATALALEHVADAECPELVVRPGVDPTKLFLISPDGERAGRRGMGRVGMAIAGLAVAAAAVAGVSLVDRANRSHVLVPTDTLRTDSPRTPADSSRPIPEHVEAPFTKPSNVRSREPAVAPPPTGGSRQTVRPPRDTGRTVTAVQPLQSSDPAPILPDTPPNRTIPPAFPR